MKSSIDSININKNNLNTINTSSTSSKSEILDIINNLNTLKSESENSNRIKPLKTMHKIDEKYFDYRDNLNSDLNPSFAVDKYPNQTQMEIFKEEFYKRRARTMNPVGIRNNHINIDKM